MEKPQTPFTNFDTIGYICQFLKLRDKLILGATNKQVGYLINEHLKLFMKQNGLPRIRDKNERQMVKFYLNRNVRAVRIPTLMHQGKQESTNYNFLKGKLIVKIDAGNDFTIFKDNKSNAYYTKTSMLTSKFNPKAKFQSASNIKKAFGKGSKMFLLHNDGTVTATKQAQGENEVAGGTDIIEWTKDVPVQDMVVSYNFAIFVLGAIKISTIKKKIFNEEFDEDVAMEEARGKWIKILGLNLLNGKYTIIKYPMEELKSFCVGYNMAYFIDGQNRLYQCELNSLNEGQQDITVHYVPAFQNKSVVKVWSGFHYYIALCRSEYLLDKWDNARVLEWLRKEDFHDYINIMRVEKVDGKRLLDLDKDRKYLTDVLGVLNASHQQKMLLSIQKNQEISYAGDELYGWGNNNAGQLGNSMAQYVQKPIKIRLPEFAKNEYIDDISCGWFNTMIKTNTNRLFISILSGEHEKEIVKGPKEQEISDEELKKDIERQKRHRKKTAQPDEDFRREGKDNKEKDKKKKKEVEGTKKKSYQDKKQEKHHEKFEVESKWIEYKTTRPFAIDSARDIMFFTQLAYKEEESKKKVRTAKAAIDKVLWDPNLDQNEFSVGYFDKYMGVLETKIDEYQKSEIKEHRLIYLKKAGTIVWHREDKIDLL